MDKSQLKKNTLDLRYHFESQKINAVLVVCSVGILTFIGTFIWYRERLFFGIWLSLIVIITSIFLYSKTKRRMNRLLEDIEHIDLS